jgi:zinc protease
MLVFANHCQRLMILVAGVLMLSSWPSSAHGAAGAQKGSLAVSPSQAGEKQIKILGPFVSRDDKDEYTRVVLKNGLTAILYERKDVSLVSISTYVKAGYLDEPDAVRGIAHVVEHMFFKGTKRRGAGELDKETKALGGYLNAETDYEYTHYYTVLPSEHFRQGLEMQADALQNLLFPEVELKREIQVILQEARRKADSADAYATEKLYEVAFEVSPIRRWRIGDETTLLPLTRQDVKDFYHRWYVPSNIIVVVCGNVDRRAALDELVRKYAGMIPVKLERAGPAVEPMQKQLRYRQLRGDIAEARTLLGFPAPPAFGKDWYVCQVLRAMLIEGESSILNRELKQDRGWVSSVESSSLDLKDEGYLAFRLNLDAAHLNSATLAVFVELEKIKSGAFDEQDIQRAKHLLERKAYLDREELDDFGFQLAHYEALASYREWREEIRKLRAVTREQLVQAAKTYFTLSRCSLLEYLPYRAGSRDITPESLLTFVEQRLPAAVEEARKLEDIAEPKNLQKGKAPVSRSPAATEISSAWVDSPLTEYSILRGPGVMVKESRALPLISIGVFFPGGRIFEGRSNSGITELMVRTSAKESLKMDAFHLLASLEQNGAKLETRVEPDFFGYVLTGLKASFEKNLDVLLAVLKEPRFDEQQIQKEKALLLAEAARVTDNQVSYSRQLVRQALYGEHPYGLPALGSAESIQRVSREELVEWHTQFVKSAVPVVVISGDTEGSELVAQLSNHFSRSAAETIDLRLALPVKPLDRISEKLEERNRQQSTTSLGFLTLGASEPETRILTVVANLVSGPGGRFFEEVREKQGLAYSVSATYQPAALGGCFLTYVATSPENRMRVVDTLREQIRKLNSAGVSEEELARGKNYSSGAWKMRLQRRANQVFEFARLRISGLSLDEIREYSSQYDFVRPEMVRDACRKFLELNSMGIGGILGGGRK